MNDSKTFSRYVIRCGSLLRSDRKSGKVVDIKSQYNDPGVLILTAKSLGENKNIEFLGTSFPLLAENVLYEGEPIAAIFSPDFETTALVSRSIEVIYEEDESSSPPYLPPAILHYSWGEKIEESDDVKTVESEFKIDASKKDSGRSYLVSVWIENANLHVECPTSWPQFVRSSVSKVTGFPLRNIIIHPLLYPEKYDEFLFSPAILASLAAIAVIKTNVRAEIGDSVYISRPEITVKRSTVINSEGRPLSENVEMTVDEGAFPICSQEYQRQAMAGLIPSYPLKYFHASVSVKLSKRFPSSFCASLGYSEAVASREYHISSIAEKLHIVPTIYRYQILTDKRRISDYLTPFSLDMLNETTKNVNNMSFYERKWSSNLFQKKRFGLIGEVKGIGLATATGISGFSSSFLKDDPFKSSISYTKRGITVSTSFTLRENNIRVWEKEIRELLNTEDDIFVYFAEYGAETEDSGPDVLSRSTASYTPRLLKAVLSLKEETRRKVPPISFSFNTEDNEGPAEFESSAYGSLALEIKVEKNNPCPVVTGVWASFIFSRILDKKTGKGLIKSAILASLFQNGAIVSDDMTFSVDIAESGQEGSFASIASLSSALVMGALSSALHQTAGSEASSLPVSSDKLCKALFTKVEGNYEN